MKLQTILLSVFALIALVGCGGSDAGPKTSTVSGRVTYSDGLPARSVKVIGPDGETYTSTNGAFILTRQRASDFLIKAEVEEGGILYVGQQLAQTSQNQQSGNVNIMLVAEGDTASVQGFVTDRSGSPIQDATILAFGAGALSSSKVLTDRTGKFVINRLMANENYTISASGGDYAADTDQITLDPGERARLDFVLSAPGNGQLSPPQNLSIIAWTSPVSRDRAQINAIESVKQKLSPARAKFGQTRLSPQGNPIEMELEWDAEQFSDLFGYGIYRGRGNDAIRGYDFSKETLSGIYIDSDKGLLTGASYSYQVTQLGSTYTSDNSDQSDRSGVVSATPLGDMVIRGPSFRPLRFNWDPCTGATSYVVYLFEEFPGFDVNWIWNNSSNRATGTSQIYNGNIPLTSGKQYYYLLLATANGDTSRSLSEVGTFIYQP